MFLNKFLLCNNRDEYNSTLPIGVCASRQVVSDDWDNTPRALNFYSVNIIVFDSIRYRYEKKEDFVKI